MSDFHLGKTSLKKLENVDERLVNIVKQAIKETTVDFSVVQGFRSAEEQNKLYQIGRTIELDRSPVTNCDGYKIKSRHQSSLAVDIVPYKNGKLLWEIKCNEAEWLEIGRAMLRSARLQDKDLEWGITYNIGNHFDLPHFQLLK